MPDLRDRLQLSLGHSYTIERELGGGGMSRVFVANETSLGRPVVVKVLAPELAAGVSAERFQREIKLAAALQHPNIVPVHAAGAAGDLPYYTMPFVDGLSLRTRLDRGDAVPIAEVERILKDVARALSYAHDHGVVHRDIKPENVLLAHDTAVVTDFGIAKALQVSRGAGSTVGLTQDGTSLGTPAYMSPEQAAGDPAADHRSDIYSFGCMAYELLTGHPPFTSTVLHKLFVAHMSETPAPIEPQRPGCPKALAALVMRCLEKDPAQRPQTAREIQLALDGGAITTGGFTHLSPLRRNLAIAVAALALFAIAAWAVRHRSPGATADGARSVAVLPFDSANGDTANAYFGEGIAEELITALSKVQGLRVAGKSSSFRLRAQASDSRDIGRTLNVASLLEGSVRRSGSRMKVTAQLTNAADGIVLWSDSYERDIKDAFAVQDEIARAIVGALQVRLVPAASATLTAESAREVNPEAYDLYLRGLAFFRLRGKYIQPAVGYFEQAIAKDSMFGRAYSQLATALSMVPVYAPVSFDSLRPRTLAVALRAIALDPSSGEAHAALGTVYGFSTLEYAKALVELDRATALDPNYSPSYYLVSNVLSLMGQYDRSVSEARHAVDLDPISPIARYVLAKNELPARMYTDAAANGRRAVELDSLYPMGPAVLAEADYFLGHTDVARQLAVHATPTPGTGPALALVLSATGDAASRAALLRRLEATPGANAGRETSLAAYYIGVGDSSRALAALERAAVRKEPLAPSMGFGSPAFDALRASARFTAILRNYGLDPDIVNSAARRVAH
jgi:serine/threonine-protein kinase